MSMGSPMQIRLKAHPYFIRRYIHHRHSASQQQQQQPFTLLLQYTHNYEKNILVLPSHDSEFFTDCTNVGLDFLSFLPLKARKNNPFRIEVEATFNDLLLVRYEDPPGWSLRESRSTAFCEYYICNPLTKQWLTLPPRTTSFVMVGFVCKEQGCVANVRYRYKVVRIHSPAETNTTQLRMEIFSSETGEWRDSVVSSPRGLSPFEVDSLRAGVVACNGMLHWVDIDEDDNLIKGFVVFDPFNGTERCHYINPPADISPEHFVFIGVFLGRLRIFGRGRGHNDAYNFGYFSVWELEDYSDAGTWGMKYKVHFNDMVSEHSELVLILKIMKEYEDSPPAFFLAFHPTDDEIVFLQFRHHVVLCNVKTGVLKVAGELLRDRGLILSEISGFLRSVPTKYAFLLGQPSWPTPVPPLPLKFDDESPSNC